MEPHLNIEHRILKIRLGALNPSFEGIDVTVLTYSLLTVEKKAGYGGPMASFILAVFHSNAVVLCKLLKTRLTGNPFPKYIRKCFSEAFPNSANTK